MAGRQLLLAAAKTEASSGQNARHRSRNQAPAIGQIEIEIIDA